MSVRSEILVSCNDQVLKITEAPVLASGGLNEIRVVFSFCDKWDGFVKTSIFYRDEENVYYAVLDENDTCIVPWEVCYEEGTFYFSVFGEKTDIRRTASVARYKVKKGAITTDMLPSDPTPAVYDQIIAKLAEQADFMTEARIVVADANTATEEANTATANANQATSMANVATINANQATQNANTAASNATAEAEKATQATANANEATAEANAAAEVVNGQAEVLADRFNAIYGKLSANNGLETVCGGWGYGGSTYYHMVNTWTDAAVCTIPSLLKISAYPAKVAVKNGFVGASLYDAKGNYVRNISSKNRKSLEVIDESIKYLGLNIYNEATTSVNGVPITAEECGLSIENAVPATFTADISNLIHDSTWEYGYIASTGNYDTVRSDLECIHSDYIDVSGIESIAITVPEGFGSRVFMYGESKNPIGTFVTTGQTIIPAEKVAYIRMNLEVKTSIGKQIPTSYKYKVSAKSYVYLDVPNNEKETEYGITMQYSDDLRIALAAQKDLTDVLKNNDSKVRLPSFVHVTDVHGDAECFRNACEIAKHLSATAVVNTGDTVFCYSGDDTSFIEKAVNDNGISYLVALGNHDTYQISDAQAYEKHIAPFAADHGYVLGNGTTPTYFYKDFADLKIRVLSVNQFQYSGHTTDTNMHYTQEQIDFITASLLSTPADYGVVVIMHTPEKNPVASEGYSKFFQKKKFTFNTGSSNSPITEIVDAFISGTAINKTYSNRSGMTPATFTASADFSRKNSGVEFICYCTGHRHADAVYYVQNTTNKQLMLSATCTCSMSNKNKDGTEGDGNPYLTECSDLPRVDGTSTKDSFNVYCIDRGNKSVKVVRIGSNMPYDLSEKRDFMVIPYAD